MASKFEFDQHGPLAWTTEDEQEFSTIILEWAQRQLVNGNPNVDWLAAEIQYRSEMLNGTRPSLWLNLDIWKPRPE